LFQNQNKERAVILAYHTVHRVVESLPDAVVDVLRALGAMGESRLRA
jgi:hypothetical protein